MWQHARQASPESRETAETDAVNFCGIHNKTYMSIQLQRNGSDFQAGSLAKATRSVRVGPFLRIQLTYLGIDAFLLLHDRCLV